MDFKLLFAMLILLSTTVKLFLQKGKSVDFYFSLTLFLFSFIPVVVQFLDFVFSDVNKSKTIVVNLFKLILMDKFDHFTDILIAKGWGVYCNQASFCETRHEGGEILKFNSGPFNMANLSLICEHKYKGSIHFYTKLDLNNFVLSFLYFFPEMEWVLCHDLIDSLRSIVKVLMILRNRTISTDYPVGETLKELGLVNLDRIHLDEVFDGIKFEAETGTDFESFISYILSNGGYRLVFCLKGKNENFVRFRLHDNKSSYFFDLSGFQTDFYTESLKYFCGICQNWYLSEKFIINRLEISVKGSKLEVSSRNKVRSTILLTDYTEWSILKLVFAFDWWSQNPNKGVLQHEGGSRRGSKIMHVYSIKELVEKCRETCQLYKENYHQETYINEAKEIPDSIKEVINETYSNFLGSEGYSAMKSLLSRHMISLNDMFPIISCIYGRRCGNMLDKVMRNYGVKNWKRKRFLSDYNALLLKLDLGGLTNIDKNVPPTSFCKNLISKINKGFEGGKRIKRGGLTGGEIWSEANKIMDKFKGKKIESEDLKNEESVLAKKILKVLEKPKGLENFFNKKKDEVIIPPKPLKASVSRVLVSSYKDGVMTVHDPNIKKRPSNIFEFPKLISDYKNAEMKRNIKGKVVNSYKDALIKLSSKRPELNDFINSFTIREYLKMDRVSEVKNLKSMSGKGLKKGKKELVTRKIELNKLVNSKNMNLLSRIGETNFDNKVEHRGEKHKSVDKGFKFVKRKGMGIYKISNSETIIANNILKKNKDEYGVLLTNRFEIFIGLDNVCNHEDQLVKDKIVKLKEETKKIKEDKINERKTVEEEIEKKKKEKAARDKLEKDKNEKAKEDELAAERKLKLIREETEAKGMKKYKGRTLKEMKEREDLYMQGVKERVRKRIAGVVGTSDNEPLKSEANPKPYAEVGGERGRRSRGKEEEKDIKQKNEPQEEVETEEDNYEFSPFSGLFGLE